MGSHRNTSGGATTWTQSHSRAVDRDPLYESLAWNAMGSETQDCLGASKEIERDKDGAETPILTTSARANPSRSASLRKNKARTVRRGREEDEGGTTSPTPFEQITEDHSAEKLPRRFLDREEPEPGDDIVPTTAQTSVKLTRKARSRRAAATEEAHQLESCAENEKTPAPVRRSARIRFKNSGASTTNGVDHILAGSQYPKRNSLASSGTEVRVTSSALILNRSESVASSAEQAKEGRGVDLHTGNNRATGRRDERDELFPDVSERPRKHLRSFDRDTRVEPMESPGDREVTRSTGQINENHTNRSLAYMGVSATGSLVRREDLQTSPTSARIPRMDQSLQNEPSQLVQNNSATQSSGSSQDFIDPNITKRGRLVTVSADCSNAERTHSQEDTPIQNSTESGECSEQRETRSPESSHGRRIKRKYTYFKRRKGTREEGKYQKRRLLRLKGKDDSTVQSWPCCQKLSCFENVNVDFFRHHRRKLMEASQGNRKRALAEMLQEDGRFYFDQRPVCTFFLMTGFGFSKDLQRSVKGTPEAPSTISIHRTNRSDTRNEQRQQIMSFLRDFAAATADKMPDSDEQHLPLSQKKLVYDELVQNFRTSTVNGHEKAIPSYSYFVTIWNEHLPKIKVRKVPRFTKCTECEMIRDALAKGWKDPKTSNDLLQRRRNHLSFITSERASYMSRSNMAARRPDEYSSIVIDGADQRSFGLPHFNAITKDTKGEAIKVKLVGVLEHAAIPVLTLYTLTAEFQTGANHIIEAIHRWMNQRRQIVPLPPTLFIQADNCSRENKNRYLFGYVESLVVWGVFEEVQISFLPIGHTHSDIDQKFSCTSNWMKNHNAVTMKELHAELRKAYNPTPFVYSMNHVANISGLMDMEKVFATLPTIVDFFYFKFIRSGQSMQDGRLRYDVKCLVKRTSQDEWSPLFRKGTRTSFLRTTPDLRNTPNTHLTCPTNFNEVEKRIVSEEPRVNDPSKMAELRELQQSIYSTREESFHWNLNECIEGKKMLGISDGEPAVSPTSFDYRTYIPRTRLDYDLNSFVVVRPKHPTKKCPFWVGRIEELLKNDYGDISTLRVLWHEVEKGESVLQGHYTPSYHVITKKRHLFWITDVPTDSVLLNFEKLNKNGTLGAEVVKKITAGMQVLDIDASEDSSSGM